MSIVIEPINVNLIVHDNPLGTVTNTPNFDWQMTNLRNYMTAKPNNVDQSKIGKIELRALSAGNGMWGISDDLNPTSRFVRAALFSAKTVPSANAEEGINQIFQLLNNFDISKGITWENNTNPDNTQIKTARDPQNLRFYDKTYDDQAIGMIVMEKLDLNAKEVKNFCADKSSQPIVDMSSMLKESLIFYHCRFGGSGCLLCTRVPLFFNSLRLDLTCHFYCTRQNRALCKSVQNHCRYSASAAHDNAAMQAALAVCHLFQRKA